MPRFGREEVAIGIIATVRRQLSGRGLALRLLLYALVWWVLTAGDTGAWVWGVPAVAGAALFNPFPANGRLRLAPLALLRFAQRFILGSLTGALDVGLRALQPARPLSPALVDYPWQLQTRSARIFMANLINLMPGTLCVRITDTAMSVHVIGDAERTVAGLAKLEQLVADLMEVEDHD